MAMQETSNKDISHLKQRRNIAAQMQSKTYSDAMRSAEN
jgi:hypothetical protein